MARIYRDGFGVPHVRASSLLDLAEAQGRVTAHDRTWQLEWQRRRATGTTAELVGESGMPWDRFSRRMMVLDTARAAHARLDEETAAFVAAFVDGVNAGLRGDAAELVGLDAVPELWPAWMPLAVFHAQHVIFAGLGGELWRRHADAVLGDDAALLSYEGPALSGSNAWAAAGGRTASGRPLIGGDPHRVIEQPGVYQQVRLVVEAPAPLEDRCDVAGFSFPGVPGVQHFAQGTTVAWAITNAMASYQDVFDEEQPACDVIEQRTERVEVRGRSLPVEVEVARTARGLVFEDGLSVRDAATELGDLGFSALLPLLRARTVDDVDRALDSWVAPVNNAIIADTHGVVRYRLAGRVPTRDPHTSAWTGWVVPPRTEVPTDGVVVSANERRGPESAAIGRTFAPPYRAIRVHALLADRNDLTAGDFVDFHNDTLLLTVPALTALVPGGFEDFDGRMDAGSAEAGRFAAWRSALVRGIVAEPVFGPFRDPAPEHRHEPVFDAWLDVTSRVALSLPTLVAAGAPFGIDLRALARAALDEVDAAGTSEWGETHWFEPVHALGFVDLPRRPVSGDQDCVRCTTSYPADTDVCLRGSVARYVWDLADRERSGWVVPTGASGDAGDPHHHDQLEDWVAGRLVSIVTDWDQLVEESSA